MFCYNYNYQIVIINTCLFSLSGLFCFYLGTRYKCKQIEKDIEMFFKNLNVNDSKKDNNNNNNTIIKEKMKYVEKLKNALLSFALMVSNKDNKELDLNYSNFDGIKLPHFSGCSVTNACFTYITDESPCVTMMAYKQEAINKYLAKNLNTEEQIIIFFDNFADTYMESSKILDFFKGFYTNLSKKQSKLLK